MIPISENTEVEIVTQEMLAKQFPQYFRLLAAGLECGPGWYGIVCNLFSTLAGLERSNPGASITIYRVKQVLGRLEITIVSPLAEAEEAVRLAALQSAQICEECGAPGFLHGVKGTAKTLCGRHGEEMLMQPFPGKSACELRPGDLDQFTALQEILVSAGAIYPQTDEKPLLIFLDTEFSSFEHPRLISIGMAAESGEEFYAELADDWQRWHCSDFVKRHVLTLLEGGRHRIDKETARQRAFDWLTGFGRTVRIVSDAPDYDYKLLLRLLGRPLPANLHPAPLCFDSVYFPVDLRPCIQDARSRNHKDGKPEHHALNDARSLLEGWREAELQSPETIRRILQK